MIVKLGTARLGNMADIIYSQPNCPGCVQLKKKYEQEGKPYTEIIIGKDISVSEFREQFPTVRTVPFVVPDVME